MGGHLSFSVKFLWKLKQHCMAKVNCISRVIWRHSMTLHWHSFMHRNSHFFTKEKKTTWALRSSNREKNGERSKETPPYLKFRNLRFIYTEQRWKRILLSFLSLLTVNIKLDSLWTNLKAITDLSLAESGTSAVDQSCSTPSSGRRRPGWRRHRRLFAGRRPDSAPRCRRWRRACRASSSRTRWATPRRLQRPSIPPYRNDNDKIRLWDPFTWWSFLRYVL